MSKPPIIDPYNGISKRPHPAKFSDSILDVIRDIIPTGTTWIFDPMAGVGKITRLGPEYKYQCNEMEPEWAKQIAGADVVTSGDCANCLIMPDAVVVTSPPYGNRMADAFVSEKRPNSMRGRYAGDLGRRLTEGSAASLKYGEKYQKVMIQAYKPLFAQMVSGQCFILNVSDFIRNGKQINVVIWYIQLFTDCGFKLVDIVPVKTPRSRGHGANWDARVNCEFVLKWVKK